MVIKMCFIQFKPTEQDRILRINIGLSSEKEYSDSARILTDKKSPLREKVIKTVKNTYLQRPLV